MDFISIIMGSKSDFSVMSECAEVLKKFDVLYEMIVSSAHRSPDRTKEYIKDAVGRCDEENPKTKLLFYTLMQDFYENRVLTVKESDKPRLAHTTNSIVLQLQAQLLQEENNG